MTEEPTNARKSFGDIAPHLAELTDKVLFGDVWANPALSPRDRSLVYRASLVWPWGRYEGRQVGRDGRLGGRHGCRAALSSLPTLREHAGGLGRDPVGGPHRSGGGRGLHHHGGDHMGAGPCRRA